MTLTDFSLAASALFAFAGLVPTEPKYQVDSAVCMVVAGAWATLALLAEKGVV